MCIKCVSYTGPSSYEEMWDGPCYLVHLTTLCCTNPTNVFEEGAVGRREIM